MILDLNLHSTLDLRSKERSAMTTYRLLWVASILLAISATARAQFTPATGSPYTVGAGPNSLAVGDFNGDGTPDLAIANTGTNNVTVLLGNGAGGFTAAPGSPIPVGADPFSVAVGDFNRDGNPDLAIANANDYNVTVLLGNGAGGFTAAPGSPFPVGTVPDSVAVGDFNGDGAPDLAIANVGDDTVTVLLGDGTAHSPQPPAAHFRWDISLSPWRWGTSTGMATRTSPSQMGVTTP